jgi:hypothetical protein
MRALTLALLICCFAPMRVASQQDSQALPTVTKFDCPQYPERARLAHISGTVTMRVTTDGHAVIDVKVISGPQILAQPAESNVRTWKFADHPPTNFTVIYVYANDGYYKKDSVTKCAAKMELPQHVTISTKIPFSP